jgi:hypothetical protein
MLSFRARWLMLALIVLLASPPSSATAQQSDGWFRLFTGGQGQVSPILLSPDWPNDRLILARLGDRLVRSPDGGSNWEHLGPWPSESMTLGRYGGTRVALAYGKTGIKRSTDDGTTWQDVLPLELKDTPSLERSAGFSENGRVLVDADDRVYLSTDAGATWTQIAPVAGQRVFHAGFWTDSPPGRDIYALVTTEPIRWIGTLYRGDGTT